MTSRLQVLYFCRWEFVFERRLRVVYHPPNSDHRILAVLCRAWNHLSLRYQAACLGVRWLIFQRRDHAIKEVVLWNMLAHTAYMYLPSCTECPWVFYNETVWALIIIHSWWRDLIIDIASDADDCGAACRHHEYRWQMWNVNTYHTALTVIGRKLLDQLMQEMCQ